MGKADYVKFEFEALLQRIEQVGAQLEELRAAAESKPELRDLVKGLEAEIIGLANQLSTSGVNIIKKVA